MTEPRDVIATVLYETGGVFEVEVTQRLAERRSAFQDILVVDTVDHGRCLVIDGVMQTASTDHTLYDDAILARLRPDDHDVLILGGGDGYVARRAHQRAPLARITVVDIDPEVVDLAEAWLNPGFRSDARTQVHIGDGLAFAQGLPRASLDGVVLDLTDIPLDPARSADVTRLFGDMLDAVLPLVRPGGWIAMQGGPSRVAAGAQDVAALVGELLAGRVTDLRREDVFLPSYGEDNAFFHGTVPSLEINWRDRTEGLGLATALAFTPVYAADSPAGRVEVLDHVRLGRALVVDGVLQDIALDAGWREMLVHVPLLGHPRTPRRVLVVGGADGLVVREVLRHPFVEHVTVWDDNAASTEAARHLGTAGAFDDPRVTMGNPTGPFDVILVARPDLRRPGTVGASEVGRALARLLAEDGVLVDADAVVLTTRGARWYREAPGAGPTVRAAGLDRVGRYFTTGAVVPGGFHGFDLYGPRPLDLSAPRSEFTTGAPAFVGHHYNPALHVAAFALPRFFRELA